MKLEEKPFDHPDTLAQAARELGCKAYTDEEGRTWLVHPTHVRDYSPGILRDVTSTDFTPDPKEDRRGFEGFKSGWRWSPEEPF